jgi:hypothetical protein
LYAIRRFCWPLGRFHGPQSTALAAALLLAGRWGWWCLDRGS